MSDTESWGAYATDAEEALGEIEQALLSLETTSDPAVVNRLYRALHTIKGNSGFLHLRSIERVAHAAESVMGLVRDQGRAIDEEIVDLLFQLVDSLRRLIDAAAAAREDVYDPEIEPLVSHANTLTGTVLAETRDEGLHLFDEEPTPDGLDDDGFFRALALASWSSITRNDDSERALNDLQRAALRTGRVDVAAAADCCLRALPPSSDDLAALASALLTGGVDVSTSEVSPAPATTSTDTTHISTPHPTPPTPTTPTTPTLPARAADSAPKSREDTTLRIDGSKATTLMALTGELGLAVHAVTRHPGVRRGD